MNAADVLADADLRVEWANQHIQHFEKEIQLFHARESYRVIRNVDPQHPNLVKITDPPRIPPQLNLIASDAVHNMRVALDYFACSLAVLNGKSMSSVYFPFAADAGAYGERQTQEKINKLSPDAKCFIDGLKPYKGGNNFLWAVHEINKTDKHRNLLDLDQAAPMAYFTPRQGENACHPVTGAQLYDYEIKLVPGLANLEGFEGQSALTLVKEFLANVATVLKDGRALFFPGTESIYVFG